MGLDSRSKYVPPNGGNSIRGNAWERRETSTFDEKIDDFRGLGRPWGWLGAGLEPGSLPGPILRRKPLPFGSPFLVFSGIFQCVFFSVFPGALFFRIVCVLKARGSPKGRFWDTILKTFWG